MYCGVGSNAQGLSTFVLQMDRETGKELESGVRRIVYDFDPYVRVSKVQTIDALIADTLWMERLTLSVLKVLSAFAFVLAIVGMFSVIAYSVDRRTGEFGVRMALGATPTDLVWLVFRRAIALSVGGIVIGIAGALGLTRFMQSLLYETQTYDPLVHLLVAAALLAATAVACWLPARRATRVDITSLLKAE
jgi:ABC-type antimicrobial peptide transport system permease subunit